ncbi:conserved putative secreted protein [Candidatus Protochlamydia naegleriophila]|uniref:Conserved putative secreted protein n=1 Tax=Candidatus Protochlamydia naegleriophila TaxID=389348 RepID=A0A0U5JBQ5_9BACT|nr:hypothetical protein [Candidatus Protochlamydia naegleriophila]CUI16846.1 conserved putative secreted protein [Candidatus Protochlamydia naegleriophila]
MQKIAGICLAAFFSLSVIYSGFAHAQTGPGGSRMESLPPMHANRPNVSITPGVLQPKPMAVQPLVPQQASYLHPGVIVFRNNTWEGGDHLLNLTNNIGIYVTIVKPEGDQLDVTEDQLKKLVEEIFRSVNINPVTLAPAGQPPLPAFQIQVLAYPIDKGYVAACEGRLFESVTLQRFILDPAMAFQAITWEKKSLQVGPTTKIAEQIQSSVAEIAQSFAERFDAYERRKREMR